MHMGGFHKGGKVTTTKRGNDVDKICECNVCGKVLSNAGSLKNHKERSHGDPQLKRHVCELCSRRFYDKRDCERHKLVHKRRGIVDKEKSKFTMCDACGKEVTTNRLKSHIARVHEKHRPFSCSFCEKKFFDSKDLRVHVAGFHKGGKRLHVDKEKPKFTMCDACGKQVTTNKLKTHIDRVHKKIRRYPCLHCSRKYYDKKDLKVHLQIHDRKLKLASTLNKEEGNDTPPPTSSSSSTEVRTVTINQD